MKVSVITVGILHGSIPCFEGFVRNVRGKWKQWKFKTWNLSVITETLIV
jgi:hypothetical protein